ncbi:MAG: ATP-binding cassette, subfamily multidrug efflux pump [Candidatus Poribacteria bacterium]|nr:ATP-binding cassette, subfamily multidrug efflux pump [Candidatus Poribacteria bacterium]
MHILRRLLAYLSKYWYFVLLALLALLINRVLTLAIPEITQRAIDIAIVQKRHELLAILALSIVGVTILTAIFQFVQEYILQYASQKAIYDIRNTMYDHLQRLPFSFYDKSQTGQLIARATGDIDTLRRFYSFGMINFVSSIIMFIAVLIICLLKNSTLAVLSLSTMPILAYTGIRFGGKIGPRFWEIRQRTAELTTVIQENFTGMRVVKTFVREDYEINKFSAYARNLLQKNLEITKLWSFFFPLMDFIAGLGSIAVLWYGGWQIMNGNLTLGEFIAFNMYLMQLMWPIRMLGFIINVSKEAMASGQRIFEILDTKSEVEESPDAKPLPQIEGHVRFENVSFKYETSDELVLKNFSLDVEPGETVAILGATGSGKSTLINLIPRFYDPTSGVITIDNIDIKTTTLESLRSQIGIVLQDTFLFAMSLKDNIAYGRNNATMEEIINAAKAANIHDFIDSLPKGYDSEVGERGVTLSGGEKQRVAIARALLMNPKILILDDSTSSVDTETEHLIQNAIATLVIGRTTFVIAQRLSTIKRANKIVVLENGEIVEQGTHDELMEKGGIYTEIYNMQFKQQEEIQK